MIIIPNALWLLAFLRVKAVFRRIFRGMKSVRGCLMTLFFLFMMTWWIPFMFFNSHASADREQAFNNLSNVIEIPVERLPSVSLLLGCLLLLALPARGPGIQFMENDVEFLFAGPFRRRHLVIFKLLFLILGVAYLSLILSFFSFRNLPGGFLQTVTCAMLSLGFLYLFRTLVSMAAQSVLMRLHTRLRKIALVILVLCVLAVASPVLNKDFIFNLDNIRSVILVLSIPFTPFANALYAAEFFTGFLPWAVVAATMDFGLILLILWLDVDYRDAATKRSREIKSRVERIQKNGPSLSAARVKNASATIPSLPRFGGTGALLWRQLVTARRHGTKLSIIIFGAPAIICALHFSGQNEILKAIIIPVASFLIFFIPQMIQFDFRSDYNKLAWLKTLPVSAKNIALGQLCTPILLASTIYCLALSTFAILVHQWILLVAVILFVPPLVTLMYSIENLLFLLLPLPPMQRNAGDPRQFFMLYVVLLLKLLAIVLTAGSAAGLGGFIYWLSSSAIAGFGGAYILLLIELAPIIWLIGYAFQRFDINRISTE